MTRESKFPISLNSLQAAIRTLGNHRRDGTADISYRRRFVVQDGQEDVGGPKSVLHLNCPEHGQFECKWRHLVYAGRGRGWATCPPCDLAYGKRKTCAWHDTEELRSALLSGEPSFCLIGQVTTENPKPHAPDARLHGDHRLLVECRATRNGKMCGCRVEHSVSNLLYNIRKPGFLCCRECKVQDKRRGKASNRALEIRDKCPGWELAVDSYQRDSVDTVFVHVCGYRHTCSLEKFRRSAGQSKGRRPCPVCNRRVPFQNDWNDDSLKFWLSKVAPTIELVRIEPSKGSLRLEMRCREHPEHTYVASAARIVESPSHGCPQCGEGRRHLPRNRFGETLVALAERMGALPKPAPVNGVEATVWQLRDGSFMSASLLELCKANPLLLGPVRRDETLPLRRFVVAGLYATDGFDRLGNGRKALRGAITLLAEDEPVLLAVSQSVECGNTLQYRARKANEPPGLYAEVSIVDDDFIGWLKDFWPWVEGQKSQTLGMPNEANEPEVVALLAGAFAGDGHVSNCKPEFRGEPLLSWTTSSKQVAVWTQTELNGLLRSAGRDQRKTDGECGPVRLHTAEKGRKNPVYSVSVRECESLLHIAELLLRWKEFIPLRKVSRLNGWLEKRRPAPAS